MALPVLAALVPFAVNALRVMLFVHAAKMVVGILAFFGLSIFVNKVVLGPGIAAIEAMMSTGPGGSFGATAIAWLGVLRLDDAVSMLISAWVIVNTIKNAKIALQKVGL